VFTRIPYWKTHGAGNDFLLSWSRHVNGLDWQHVARAICQRNYGIGADGWYVLDPLRGDPHGCTVQAHLFNSDGSPAELSGNGSRCVAAMLVAEGLAGADVQICTGAGPRKLRLLGRHELEFFFEMGMGQPRWDPAELLVRLPLRLQSVETVILNVGNPQAVVFVQEFPTGWRELAAEIESHPRFPERTNVSFVKILDAHRVEARFYERGAGETLSSGTGATGAAVAGILCGKLQSPVRVETPAGVMTVRWEDQVYLTGPARLIGRGEFYYDERRHG